MSEEVQHKMYNYEVTPPANVWEQVAAALDESEMTHTFPSTLYGMESTPPPGAWDKIQNALDEGGATVIPIKRRILPFLRYAVAAAVIGLIIFAGLQLISKKTGNRDIVKEEVVQPEKSSPSVATTDAVTSDSVLDTNENTMARLDIPTRTQKKTLANNFASRRILRASGNDGDNSNDFHDNGIATASVAHLDVKADLISRYVMLMTPAGNIIRMSKKLCDIVCCVSGQDQDEGCKSQLKVWQEKMASSSIAPSPGNFMDILNLVSTLQENN